MAYFNTIPATNVEQYIGRPGCIIVDLRDAEEYERSHIPGAVNIPYFELQDKQTYLNQFREIIFYCDRGNLSLLASRDFVTVNSIIMSICGGLNFYRGALEEGSNNH